MSVKEKIILWAFIFITVLFLFYAFIAIKSYIRGPSLSVDGRKSAHYLVLNNKKYFKEKLNSDISLEGNLLWFEEYLKNLNPEHKVEHVMDFKSPDYVSHLLSIFYTDAQNFNKAEEHRLKVKSLHYKNHPIRYYKSIIVERMVNGEDQVAIEYVSQYKNFHKEIMAIKSHQDTTLNYVKDQLCQKIINYAGALKRYDTLDDLLDVEACKSRNSKIQIARAYIAALLSEEKYDKAFEVLETSLERFPQSYNQLFDFVSSCLDEVKERKINPNIIALNFFGSKIKEKYILLHTGDYSLAERIIDEKTSENIEQPIQQKIATYQESIKKHNVKETTTGRISSTSFQIECLPISILDSSRRKFNKIADCLGNMREPLPLEKHRELYMRVISAYPKESIAEALVRWALLMHNSRYNVPRTILEIQYKNSLLCPINIE